MKNLKAHVLLVILISSVLLSGCFSSNNIKGTSKEDAVQGRYELVLQDSEEVSEFSSFYEILTLKDGLFNISSYYERTYFFYTNYTSTYVGELTVVLEGKYFIKDDSLKLEYFIGENKFVENYNYDSESLYKANYYSDETMGEKTKIFKKILDETKINLDGEYMLNVEKSNFSFTFNQANYEKLIISGNEFEFQNKLGNTYISGELLLAKRGAKIINEEDYSGYTQRLITIADDGISVNYDYINKLHYDRL